MRVGATKTDGIINFCWCKKVTGRKFRRDQYKAREEVEEDNEDNENRQSLGVMTINCEKNISSFKLGVFFLS